MPAVAPNTRIFLIEGVALSNDYENTIWFDDATQQADWFSERVRYRFDEYTYQRWGAGKLRVQAPVDSLYGCGYMMFGNANHNPEKWFYAFVTHMEYVNEETTELTYEIDVMQTWLFDAEVRMCFVEREHTETDELFENLVEENLDYGDSYCTMSQLDYDMGTEMNVVALASNTSSGEDMEPEVWQSKLMCGIHPLLFGELGTDDDVVISHLNAYIENGYSDALVALYQVPSMAIGTETGYMYGTDTVNIPRPTVFTSQEGDFATGHTDDTYTPRNNKLYNYPYTYIEVSDHCNPSKEFKWEDFRMRFFEGVGVSFEVFAAAYPEPVSVAVPLEYKGVDTNWDEGVVKNDFPICAWTGDAWKMWWAQNAHQSVVGVFTNAASSAINTAVSTKNVYATVGSGVASAITSVADLVAKRADLKKTTDTVFGSPGGSSLSQMAGFMGYTFYVKGIRPQFARIIDDFFDLYGYAVHRVKVPNRNVRPHWTYCKTVGMDVGGSLPADHAQKINSIYDSGIRFWVNGDEIGDYTLDNTV